MSNKNYINQTRTLVLLITLFLVAFSVITNLIPDTLGLRKIDLLADIRYYPITTDSVIAKADTISIVEPDRNEVKIIAAEDIDRNNRIEDYSSNQQLRNFTSSLKQSKQKKVRIAFFGDSFIEGDILCGDFRDTLQAIFGGQGVGFVPLASEVSQFRMTIQHTFKNWETFSLVSKKNNAPPLGFSGYCFVPEKGNLVSYKVPRRALPGFDSLRLFFVNHANRRISYAIHDSIQVSAELQRSEQLQQVALDLRNSRTTVFSFTPHDSIFLYGASLESGHGVYVDNFAMRGNSGVGLSQIAESQITEFNSFQDYDLIILQYGLNIVNERDSLGYRWYIDRMTTVINRLKTAMPETPILLISVSDRSSNQNGIMGTIPAIPVMRDAQRTIAKRTGIAFWDLYTAMGGKNSMVTFVEHVPPLGAKDYTHLTHLGGKKIAKKLAEAILELYQRYESNP